MSDLKTICAYLDNYLDIDGVEDSPRALNGLQLENSGDVPALFAAVDACEHSIGTAAGQGGGLLLVHHGVFWTPPEPIRAAAYRKLKSAITGNLAIYSAHLPLDLHPEIGNNVLLASAIGLGSSEPCFEMGGACIGRKGRLKVTRDELLHRVQNAVGTAVHLCPGGPATVERIGVLTGGAGADLAQAAQEGIDTYITGEGPHWSYLAAEELGINVLYAGHYATETFGVKALTEHLAGKFGLPWTFIDHPTGL